MKHSRLSALLGFHVESLAPGRAVLSMQVKELHKQIHDVVHGGVVRKFVAYPTAAGITVADIAAAVVDAAVKSYVGTPIAAVKQEYSFIPSPVAGGPQ